VIDLHPIDVLPLIGEIKKYPGLLSLKMTEREKEGMQSSKFDLKRNSCNYMHKVLEMDF
jgi:hypothetical protein